MGRTSAVAPRTALLVLGDAAAVMAAVLAAGAPIWALLIVPATLTALTARGLYGSRATSVLDTFGGVLTSATMGAGALLLAAATVTPSALPAAPLAHAWLLAAGLLVTHRGAWLVGQRDADRTVPTVIFGAGAAATELSRAFAERSDSHLRPVSVIPVDLDRRRRTDDPGALAAMAAEQGAHEVVIVPGRNTDGGVARLARACHARGLGVSVRSEVGEAGGALAVEQIGPVGLVRIQPLDRENVRFAVKHAMDRLAAAVALFAIAPVFVALTLAVRMSSPGPVLFRQRRVGRDGREFDMLKFRSMRPADPSEDGVASLRSDSAPGGVEGGIDRRTGVGKLMRRTSLDELPQLLNVLRGDMSLVGPRPERPEFVDRFSKDIDRYAERHRLKSGMTGLAQIRGLRGKTSISERVAYDNHYVEHWSLLLDLKILFGTVRAVLEPAE